MLPGPVVWAFLFLLIPLTNDLQWPFNQPVNFLVVVLAYPVVEEIIFRGMLQDYFNHIFSSKKIGQLSYSNMLTSVIFSVLHMLFHPVHWALLVIFPSLIFGYSKEQYLTLKAPIFLHTFYNIGFYWLFWQKGGGGI